MLERWCLPRRSPRHGGFAFVPEEIVGGSRAFRTGPSMGVSFSMPTELAPRRCVSCRKDSGESLMDRPRRRGTTETRRRAL